MAHLRLVWVCIIGVVVSSSVAESRCPTWTVPKGGYSSNNTQDCICGDSVGQMVKCDPVSLNVSLLMGKCMSYSNESSMAYVASCPYKTSHESNVYTPLPRDPSELNDVVCSPFNREGLVCSECKPEHGPSVFTNSLRCYKCSGMYHGWALYIFLELSPVTILFFAMVLFHIRLTSGGANCFLFNVQMIVSILSYGTHTGIYPFGTTSEILRKIILTVYGFWNLDFFREIIPPFCVSENINGIHALALQYLSVLYLLMLTFIVYFILEMHYRGCKLTMWLWKHIFKHLIRVKQNWTLKTSIVDSLATFLLLSYTRLMLTSFNLLYPVFIYDEHGRVIKKTLNFQESWEYFGSEHAPFAVLAIIVLLMLVLIPLLLFVIYPMKVCQRHCFRIRCVQVGLHSFVELFQGCFKDGTSDTRDFRLFSIFYFALRILMFVTHIIGFGGSPRISFLLPGLVLLGASQTILIIRPYKKNLHNIMDGVILAFGSVFCFFQTVMVLIADTKEGRLLQIAIQIGFFIPLFGILLYMVYLCIKFGKKHIVHQRPPPSFIEDEPSEIFPDRVLHPEEYSPFLKSLSSSFMNMYGAT